MSEKNRLPETSRPTGNSGSVVFVQEEIPIQGNDRENMAAREDARKEPMGFGGRLEFKRIIPIDSSDSEIICT